MWCIANSSSLIFFVIYFIHHYLKITLEFENSSSKRTLNVPTHILLMQLVVNILVDEKIVIKQLHHQFDRVLYCQEDERHQDKNKNEKQIKDMD